MIPPCLNVLPAMRTVFELGNVHLLRPCVFDRLVNLIRWLGINDLNALGLGLGFLPHGCLEFFQLPCSPRLPASSVQIGHALLTRCAPVEFIAEILGRIPITPRVLPHVVHSQPEDAAEFPATLGTGMIRQRLLGCYRWLRLVVTFHVVFVPFCCWSAPRL